VDSPSVSCVDHRALRRPLQKRLHVIVGRRSESSLRRHARRYNGPKSSIGSPARPTQTVAASEKQGRRAASCIILLRKTPGASKDDFSKIIARTRIFQGVRGLAWAIHRRSVTLSTCFQFNRSQGRSVLNKCRNCHAYAPLPRWRPRVCDSSLTIGGCTGKNRQSSPSRSRCMTTIKDQL